MKKLVLLITLLLLQIQPIQAYKVLFDYTKDETAGNSDWVIDRDFPEPQPQNPQNERDWDGAFSSFGFAIYTNLHDTVYTLHNSPITYGDRSNSMDLSNFDVFIIPEPQNPFSDREKDAIKRFVAAGGGLLMISDHNMSDRNSSGWDSPRVFNDLGAEDLFGIHFNITGDRPNSFSEVSSNIPDNTHVIINGPYGRVTALSFHAGDAMTLHPEKNSNVKGLIYKSGYSGNQGAMFSVSSYGRGRVAALGDSSPIDDGTGDSHDHLYDGWNESGTTHPQLMLNTVYWLEQRDNNNNSSQPDFVLDGILDSTASLLLSNGNTYIYTGSNDTVFYCAVKFSPQVTRTYIVLSNNPGEEVSTPWARDGYTGKFNFYFKINNRTGSLELRDSFQLATYPEFIHYADSTGFLEFTYTKSRIPSDSLYILVTGFSSDGGGKIVYATPTIDPGTPVRRYSYRGMKVRDRSLRTGTQITKAVLLKGTNLNHNAGPILYDILGRRIGNNTHLLRDGLFFNRKTKKALIILR